MRRKSKFSLPSKYMLLLLTILCVGMMFVTFVTNVNLEPVQTVSGYVIVPIQKGITTSACGSATRWITGRRCRNCRRRTSS